MTYEDEWMGRPLSSLNREELIEAVKTIAMELRRLHADHMHTIEIWKASAARKQ